MGFVNYWLYRSALIIISTLHFRYDPYCEFFIKRGPRGSKGRAIECKRCRLGRSIADIPVQNPRRVRRPSDES